MLDKKKLLDFLKNLGNCGVGYVSPYDLIRDIAQGNFDSQEEECPYCGRLPSEGHEKNKRLAEAIEQINKMFKMGE